MAGRFLGWVGRVGVLAALLSALPGCNDRPPGLVLPDAQFADAPVSVDGGGPQFTDSAIGSTGLSLARVVPGHGPFSGGNTAVLRGTGFTADALVRFGPNDVQPADIQLIDSRRLSVVVPAGAVGPVDVQVTVPGHDPAILLGGYVYDAIEVDPGRGSTGGGTFVTILGSGTAFADGDTVVFGRTECSGTTVVSANRITCRTPPSSAGYVDVSVQRGATTLATAVDAYQYYDTSDPFGGGLGGGPIHGAINLTVINAMTGDPVPEAFGIIGEDMSTIHQGMTDALGQVTFSGPDLAGPVTIHVSKFCFERTSVVAFDASDVTVFLVPWMDPMCGMGSGMPQPGRPRNGSYVQGHLQWPTDMGAMSWDNVPAVRPGWVRVAYVYATQADLDVPNPDGSLGGSTQRVLETPLDMEGFPYRIFVRPGGMAVYALAGLEENLTGRFVPYAMGIARSVLVGPGQTARADIMMDIPLDHYVDVELGALPPVVRAGPDRFEVGAYVDLGGEGIIHRCVHCETGGGQDLDVVRRRDAAAGFRFVPQPALASALSDGRYRFVARWATGAGEGQPETEVVQQGVTAIDELVHLPDFLAIPVPDAPTYGDRLPADRVLRWHADGGPAPDLHVILMLGGDGNPAWRMFAPGSVTSAPIPDLSSIPGIDDISPGTLYWVVYAIKIPGFDFNTFSYAHLNARYWSHHSADSFFAQL